MKYREFFFFSRWRNIFTRVKEVGRKRVISLKMKTELWMDESLFTKDFVVSFWKVYSWSIFQILWPLTFPSSFFSSFRDLIFKKSKYSSCFYTKQFIRQFCDTISFKVLFLFKNWKSFYYSNNRIDRTKTN